MCGMVVVFVLSCAALLTRVEANRFNDIFDISRSTLNATFNVLDMMMEMLGKLPPSAVRQYVPRTSTKQLYALIISETQKEVKNKLTLSQMLFKNGAPYPATSTQQDLTQVSKLMDRVGKWTLSLYAPAVKKALPSWKLYDTDPRWYPDCVGRYRCKRVHEYDDYSASRSLSLENPQVRFKGDRLLHMTDTTEAYEDGCNRKSTSAFNSGINASETLYRGGKSMKHGRPSVGRVRPRDIKVNYLK